MSEYYRMPVIHDPGSLGVNPLATGAASFLDSMATEHKEHDKEQHADAQKQAYYSYLEELLNRKLTAAAPLNTAKAGYYERMPAAKSGADSAKATRDLAMFKAAQADYKEFMDQQRKNPSYQYADTVHKQILDTAYSKAYFSNTNQDPARSAYIPMLTHATKILTGQATDPTLKAALSGATPPTVPSPASAPMPGTATPPSPQAPPAQSNPDLPDVPEYSVQ